MRKNRRRSAVSESLRLDCLAPTIVSLLRSPRSHFFLVWCLMWMLTEAPELSIDQFPSAYPWSGVGGSRLSRVIQMSLSPPTFSSSSWSTLGSPLSWACPENLQRKAPRSHPNHMSEPPQLAHFGAAALLSPQMSKLLTLFLSLIQRRKLISWAVPAWFYAWHCCHMIGFMTCMNKKACRCS